MFLRGIAIHRVECHGLPQNSQEVGQALEVTYKGTLSRTPGGSTALLQSGGVLVVIAKVFDG